MKHPHCRQCNKTYYGRKDKIFCSLACKNEYHSQLRKATSIKTIETDKILHRNRSILFEIMGVDKNKVYIPFGELAKRNFKFDYTTGIYENAKGKRYHIIYDFSWMKFSNGRVAVFKRKTAGFDHGRSKSN